MSDILTQEERSSWHTTLKDRLGDKYDEDLVDKKLDECSKGWERAPKTFEQRVDRKFFHKPPIRKKVEPKEVNVEDDPIFVHLSSLEIVLWKKRYDEYMGDFAFNSSSDISLLRQLIFEEIIQARCMINRLSKNRDQIEYEEQLNNSVKRLIELQKILGINRDKRKDILDVQKGDIASLSSSLDDKIKLNKKEQERDFKEEEFYLNKKSERPPINILPPLASLASEDSVMIEIDSEVQDPIKAKKEPKRDMVTVGIKI